MCKYNIDFSGEKPCFSAEEFKNNSASGSIYSSGKNFPYIPITYLFSSDKYLHIFTGSSLPSDKSSGRVQINFKKLQIRFYKKELNNGRCAGFGTYIPCADYYSLSQVGMESYNLLVTFIILFSEKNIKMLEEIKEITEKTEEELGMLPPLFDSKIYKNKYKLEEFYTLFISNIDFVTYFLDKYNMDEFKDFSELEAKINEDYVYDMINKKIEVRPEKYFNWLEDLISKQELQSKHSLEQAKKCIRIIFEENNKAKSEQYNWLKNDLEEALSKK